MHKCQGRVIFHEVKENFVASCMSEFAAILLNFLLRVKVTSEESV